LNWRHRFADDAAKSPIGEMPMSQIMIVAEFE